MKAFVNGVLNELTTNDKLKDNSIIRVIAESTKTQLAMGSGLSKTYNSLKENLKDINEQLKLDEISNLLSQFDKFESTDERKVADMTNELGLLGILENIKASDVYKDPVVMHNVALLEDSMMRRNIPEFKCYGEFLHKFNKYSYDNVVKESIDKINTYVGENRERLIVLDALYEMSNSQIYQLQSEILKDLLLSESYTSDIIKMKMSTELPLINDLVRNLSTLEAAKSPDFSLGLGNEQCVVESTIAPAIKLDENTLLTFMDDKFFLISQSDIVNEEESSIKRIATAENDYVKTNFEDFYNLCESFQFLNFGSTERGMISGKIKGFELELNLNEEDTFEVSVNGKLLEDLNSFDFNGALVTEFPETKAHVKRVLENIEGIYNFDFIKKIKNNVSEKEALVIELDKKYYVCEKLNAVERDWKADLNEYKLYRYILENFKYDISPIFKFEIEDELQKIRKIDERKSEITANISKLEASVVEIDEAINSGEIDEEHFSELENIKEQIENKIISLKENFISLDLKKKESLA